ncbi:MAG TPA: CDGSH iron-sulfur domain-containing protein, partial [Reyranella sp.]
MTEPVVAAKAPAKVTLEAGKDYWWCACGQSRNQPFCDGSHKGGAFTPIKYT